MRLHVQTCPTLRGSVAVPGDKSITHRALLLGAIAQGVSTVRNWLPAADCQATFDALRALGVGVEPISPSDLLVHGAGLRGLQPPAAPIDCQGSGTTMRLLAGILAGQPVNKKTVGRTQLQLSLFEQPGGPRHVF